MEKICISEEAQRWINSAGRASIVPVGIYMDGNSANFTWIDNGKVHVQIIEMKYKEITGFYVPPAYFGLRCAADLCYGQVLKNFLISVVGSVCEQFRNKKILLAFNIPERNRWIRDMTAYGKFLNDCFLDIHIPIASLLIPDSVLFSAETVEKRNQLTVIVRSEWTELILLCGDGCITTNAHLGLKAHESPSDPVRVRMNDYLHNSTEKWGELAANSWHKALSDVLQELSLNSWKNISDRQIVCSDTVWDAISRSDHFRRTPFSRIENFSYLLARYTETMLLKKQEQKEEIYSPNGNKSEKKPENIPQEDIWSLDSN